MLYQQKDILFSLSKVLNLLNTFKLHELVHTKDSLATNVQAVFKLKSNELEQILLEFLLTHALESERTVAGTFYTVLQKTALLLSNNVKYQHDTTYTVRDVYEDDVQCLVQIDDRDVKNMLLEAIRLVGLTNNIVVEISQQGKNSVELTSQYAIDLSPAIDVRCKFKEPLVIVADAYVENVAEISTLLDSISEVKQPAVFFMRGYHEEVINTLSVNWKRGTLKIVPVCVPFDLEHCNTLNDIAVICGCEMHSSLQGKLVSTLSVKDAVIVKNIDISNNVLIENPITASQVAIHLKSLKTKRDQLEFQELTESFYDKRIKRLSANKAVLRLKQDNNTVVNRWQIDRSIYRIRGAVLNGIDVNTQLPVIETIVSNKHAENCVKQIKDLGAIVSS